MSVRTAEPIRIEFFPIAAAVVASVFALAGCTTASDHAQPPDVDGGLVAGDAAPGLPADSHAGTAPDAGLPGGGDTGGATADAGPGPDAATPLRQCDTDEDCVQVFGDLGPCVGAACDVGRGLCVQVAVGDGTPCDDGNECTTSSLCGAGLCLPAADAWLECFDANPCTTDDCDPDQGCVFRPVAGGPCDDGDPCTEGDHCQDGACVPGQDICPAQCGNGSCQTTKGEDCASCPLDCGPCSDGCTESASAGCGGCACEQCVCVLRPACCTDAWDASCVSLCESQCGQACP